MTTIDDLGRLAARAALADAQRDLDATHGLAEVLAAAPLTTTVEPYEAYGTRPTRVRWLAVAASIAVVAGTAVALAVLSDDHRSVVPVGTIDTTPTSTPTPTTEPTPTPTPTEPATTDVATTDVATTDVATTAPPTSGSTSSGTGFTIDSLGIEHTCSPICTSLAFDPAGNLVVYDPAAATLRVLGPTPRTVDVSAAGLNPQMSFLEIVDADQVAYLATQPVDASDPVGDLVAVSTAGPRAGEIVARASGIDLSGDTDLVAAPMGVVTVGCCDAAPERPDPAAEPILGWYDANGAQTFDGARDIRVGFADGTATVVRVDGATSTTRWTIPDVTGPRGMPPLVATTDGGAMISLQDTFDATSPSRIVVMRPDGSIEERTIDEHQVLALSPDGSVLVLGDDGVYARLRLDGVVAPAPAVTDDQVAMAPFVDPDVCAVTATTVHAYLDEPMQPFGQSATPPMSIQVVGSPAPEGAAEPFAVVLRYASPSRPVGTSTQPIGEWDVGVQVYTNGNGEARWDLPDGTQGYLRSRGLDEADIVGIIGRLTARPPTAAVPGFDHDDSAAPAGLRLVGDSTAVVSGSVGYATCVAPATGLAYRITSLDGDPALVFLGVIDRPVPLAVGVVGDDVIAIEGYDDGNQPSIADVVDRPAGA